MFHLQNFSILTDVQFCTEGWGGCTLYSTVRCTVLSQEAAEEVIRAIMQPPPGP